MDWKTLRASITGTVDHETVDGSEVRGANHRLYLLREYRRWQNRYWWNWGQELPEDLRFKPYTPPVCP